MQSSPTQTTAPTKKIVCIVEDNVQLAEAIQQKLQSEGHIVELVTTGKAALAMVQPPNPPPDLILLDVMLPGGMHGFDVLERIKANEQLKHIPVVVLTNLDSEEKTAKTIGAVDYIIKNEVSLEDVVARIKQYLN